MIHGLDLFSGIGGISLALKPWVRTVCYVEIDRYCQAVLMSRMRSGDLEHAPIWDDIKTFDPRPWIGKVDIVSGGFPCQDISTAGKGAGLDEKRSGLFFEIIRVSSIIKPAFIFLENVPAILGRGGETVISEIASLGYDTRWGILSAYDVGAPHLRKRWWCLAYAGRTEWRTSPTSRDEPHGDHARRKEAPSGTGERCQDVADTSQQSGDGSNDHGERQSRQVSEFGDSFEETRSFGGWWSTEPDVGRVANGVPFRVDRLKGLGNSVVPACAREAFKRLMGVTA